MSHFYSGRTDLHDLHVSDANPLDTLGVRFYESKAHNIHEYRDSAGVKIPGTTSVIGDIVRSDYGVSLAVESNGLIDNITLNRAAERGTRIHKGIEHVIKGEAIPEGVLHAGDQKHVDSFIKWKNSPEGKAFDWDRAKSEVSAYSKELGVAGTTDILVPYKGDGNRWHAWEIKTTSEIHRGAALQQAANIAQAKENFPEIASASSVDRGVLHFPDSGPFRTVSDKRGHAPYKTLAEDTAEFALKAKEYIANGGIPAPSKEHIGEIAAGILYEKVHGTPDFKSVYLGVDENGAVDKDAFGLYKEEADKLGFDLIEDGVSASGKSKKFNVKQVGSTTDGALKRAKAAMELTKKKEQKSAWSQIRNNYNDLKSTEVGDAVDGMSRAAEGLSGSLMEALSKGNNLKYAAVGGAIGYAGGAIHAALRNTDDPTSTYKEERHIMAGALKGAVTAGAVGVAIATTNNMRNGYSEEMVGTVGGMARGFCKSAVDVMKGAWSSAGARLIK